MRNKRLLALFMATTVISQTFAMVAEASFQNQATIVSSKDAETKTVASTQSTYPTVDSSKTETYDYIFNVTGGVEGVDYTYADKTLTVLTNTPLEIDGILNNVIINEGIKDEVYIYLNGITAVSNTQYVSAFAVNSPTTIILMEDSENTITSSRTAAGIENNEIALTIDAFGEGEKLGQVKATGGSGAGIGAGYQKNSKDITIINGNIEASGYTGIGGGYGSDYTVSNITILGGEITATGSSGAGIGGYNGQDVDGIYIHGGIIVASGRSGIGGCGYSGGNTTKNIVITGGDITATGSYSSGIGGAIVEGIDISGGTIYAKGGVYPTYNYYVLGAAGIGSEYACDATLINISGGKIYAASGVSSSYAGYHGMAIGSGCAGIDSDANKGGNSYNTTISGGYIEANGGIGSKGITANLTISGGVIVATGLSSSVAIGGSTTLQNFKVTGGVIVANGGSSINIGTSTTSASTSNYSNSVIFDGWDNPTVYGDAVLTEDFELPVTRTLEIAEDTSFTVAQDVEFTLNGTISNSGTFVIYDEDSIYDLSYGTIEGDGDFFIVSPNGELTFTGISDDLKYTGSELVSIEDISVSADGTIEVMDTDFVFPTDGVVSVKLNGETVSEVINAGTYEVVYTLSSGAEMKKSFTVAKADSVGTVSELPVDSKLVYGEEYTIKYTSEMDSTPKTAIVSNLTGTAELVYGGKTIAKATNVAENQDAELTFTVNSTNFDTALFDGTTSRDFTVKWSGNDNLSANEKTVQLILEKADFDGTKTASSTAKFGTSSTVDLSTLVSTLSNPSITVSSTEDENSVLDGACTISGTTLSFAFADDISKVSNTAEITLSVSSDTYKDFDIVVTLEVIDKLDQDISYATSSVSKTYGDNAFTNTLTQTTVDGTVSYTSSNENIATVNANGEVTIKGAGEVTITATAEETSDYAEATASYTLNIAKASITIKADNKSMATDATVPSLTYTTTGLVNNDTLASISITPSVSCEADGKTAGTYSIVITGDASTDNYNISYTNGSLVVSDKLLQTISFEETQVSKIYGDDNFTNTLTHSVGDGLVSYTSSNENIATVNANGEVTINSVGEVTITATVSETADYAEATASYTIEIANATITDTTNKSQSLVYTGLELSVSNPTAQTVDNSEISVVYNTEKSFTDVGTYEISYTLQAENHNDLNGTISFKITKADSDIQTGLQAPSEVTFGDDLVIEFTPEVMAMSLNEDTANLVINGEVIASAELNNGSYTFTYDTSNKDLSVGLNTLQVNFGGSNNLNGTSIDVEITLNAQDISDKIINQISSEVYTSNAITPQISIDGLVLNQDFMVSYSDNVNVGTANVTATGIGYYTGNTAQTFEITKAEFTQNTEVSGVAKYGTTSSVSLEAFSDENILDAEFTNVYVNTNDAILVDVSIEDDKLQYTFVDDIENTGKIAQVLVTVSSRNYNDFDIVVDLRVTDKDIPVVTVESFVKTYDGKLVTIEDLVLISDVMGEWSFKDENTSFINVSDSAITTLVFTPENIETHEIIEENISIKIEQKEIIVSATDKSVTVGSSQPTYTYKVSGLVGEDTLTTEPTIFCENADLNTVGTYEITIFGAETSDNYTIAYENATLTVKTKSTSSGSSNNTTTDTNTDTDTDTNTNTDTNVNLDGSISTKVEDEDGTIVTTTIYPNGIILVTTETVNGEISTVITGVKEESTVVIPTSQDLSNTHIAIDEDGNIIVNSVVNIEGLQITISEDCNLSVENNIKTFVDVSSTDWYYKAVNFVTSRGIFNGTTSSEFSPNSNMSRAMIWTVLYRYDGGQGVTTGANWYAEAQKWAVENGISDGTNPNSDMTREQLVTILYRLEGQPAVNILLQSNEDISSWATNAMAWAVSEGILQGDTNGNINPTNTATRAEVATILMRYIIK